MTDDDEKRPDRPPTSRLGRLARLAALAPRAVPFAVEGARKLLGKHDAEDERRAGERLAADVKKAAEAMLKTLGEMKGLPLKVGQMASYIDGLAPPGHEDKFQGILKKLQDRAPPLSPEAAEQMVEQELGRPPSEIFAEWERQPFAAASIGQVHRAVTKTGEHVAVKVQYPGIDKAIQNDLKSLVFVDAMLSPMAKGLRTTQTVDEIRKVFLAELDYEREAKMADVFRRIHADDSEVHVPKVFHDLSAQRVLTTELVGGKTYADFVAEGDQSERDRAGRILWTFTFRAMLRHGVLYADPHPGNYKFLDDGRVAFLDFGCVKELPDELVGGMKRYMRTAMDGEWDEFDRSLVEELGYDPKDETWDLYRSYTIELLAPILTHEPWQCAPEKAKETVQFLARGIKKMSRREGEALPHLPYVPKMPQDFTFVNRLQWGLASVLGGMRSVVRFRPITEPLVRGPLVPVP